MNKFVIAGLQRTGTTMTVRTLNQHQNLVCFEELFIRKYPNKTPGSYEHWYRRSRARRLEKVLFNKQSVYKYLDEIYTAPAELFDNPVKRQTCTTAGFKLMYSQAMKYRSILQYIADRQVPVLLLVRENILRVLVSRTVNKKFDVAHTTEKIQTPQVELDAKTLLKSLRRMQEVNIKWENHLKKNRYIKVTYEDFVSNRAEQLNRITDFLNIPCNPDLAPPTVKLNPDRLHDVLVNYEEIKKTLETSEFDYLLTL